MSAELWALVGVVVGALLGTVGQIVNASLQRKWAKDDREAEQEQRKIEARTSAFAEVFEAVAKLTAELARSGIEEWGEWQETGPNSGTKAQVLNPAHAVDPDALRHFVASVSQLRLYVEDPILDVDELTAEVTKYLALWHDLTFRDDPDPLIERLNQLSKNVGDLYRERY